jgi:hypothetical protein
MEASDAMPDVFSGVIGKVANIFRYLFQIILKVFSSKLNKQLTLAADTDFFSATVNRDAQSFF